MAQFFKHGHMRTWELAVDAVKNLGGHAKANEVLRYIQGHATDYNTKNLRVDLDFASVNCRSRTNHAPNQIPRKSTAGFAEDALFKEGIRKEAIFHVYNPAVHGIWEIVPDPEAKSRYTVLRMPQLPPEIQNIQDTLQSTGAFDPSSISDARRRVASSIVIRRGQQGFRQSLISAYTGKCAITGCSVIDVLEAAHIYPYRGEQTNHISNGILLRADIHTLFDLGLLRINAVTLTVEMDNRIAHSEYEEIDGKKIRLPEIASNHPSIEALELKYKDELL